MCGRYFVDIEFEELMKRYNIFSNSTQINSRIGEVFPSNMSPVIYQKDKERIVDNMHWGFDLPYMKKLLINARSETAHEKRSFKFSLMKKRCLIPANRFYEWQDSDHGKVKHSIELESEICSFAGIYQDFLVDGQWQRSFVILTKASDVQMAKLHHRIPVFIDQNDERLWLDSQVNNWKDLQLIFQKPDRQLMINKV